VPTAEKNLREALSMARNLIKLADHGSDECNDDGCLVVYGIMRDCGYRLQSAAEQEIKAHESSSRKEPE
jgi:hypothetical protein